MRWFLVGLILWSSLAESGTRVQVEGHGTTIDQARLNGFRNAIEQVVGQVIISDQEVRGDQLTKDWIGGYSAGYVDDYEVLETRHVDNEYVLKMNVAVASSKIAQRMLSSGNKSLIINGQRLQAQIETQLDQRSRGDQLIAEVLSSYPYNAYVINSGQTELTFGVRRQVYIDIPYEIRWSKFWLDALNETLGVIAVDSKSCNSYFVRQDNKIRLSPTKSVISLTDTPCGQEADIRVSSKHSGDWLARVNSYYFYDRQTLEVVNNEIQTPQGRQHIGLRVNLLDAGGNVVDSRCTPIDTSTFIGYTEPTLAVIDWNDQRRNLRPYINGQASIAGVLKVQVIATELVDELARVTLTVEKTCV
jgi:hypothetical protein